MSLLAEQPLLALVGALLLGSQALSLAALLYKTLLRGGKNLKKSYGEWAVVTGATDGIGKAMAFELARKGLSVMLVGRSPEKLQAVKAELSEKHSGVQVATLVIDFAKFGVADTAKVTEALAGKEVGVLVNNVGISYAFPQWYHELTDAEVSALMTVNVESVVWMTRAVLPLMLARKRGAVVNMSSASAKVGPLLAVYASTKSFVENLTSSLAFEYAGKGIDFQCQLPLWVATSIVFPNSKVPIEKRATIGTPTAKTYAKYGVASIGYDVMLSPYWVHALAMWVQARLPEGLVASGVFSMHKGIRFHKKNVAKMEEKALETKKSS